MIPFIESEKQKLIFFEKKENKKSRTEWNDLTIR
jgi:hypothetical protein